MSTTGQAREAYQARLQEDRECMEEARRKYKREQLIINITLGLTGIAVGLAIAAFIL